MCNLCKSSADLVLTSCSGQRNELISTSVIVYVYYVKCVVCEEILYINTLYSNSNVVGVCYCKLSYSGVINRKSPSAITGGT